MIIKVKCKFNKNDMKRKSYLSKDLIGCISHSITKIRLFFSVWQRYESFEPQLFFIQRRHIT